jgi:hypothetical protein
MFVYYSILFFPFFLVGEVSTLLWKFNNFDMLAFHLIMNWSFAIVFILIEPIRLSLSFHGNRKEIVTKYIIIK